MIYAQPRFKEFLAESLALSGLDILKNMSSEHPSIFAAKCLNGLEKVLSQNKFFEIGSDRLVDFKIPLQTINSLQKILVGLAFDYCVRFQAEAFPIDEFDMSVKILPDNFFELTLLKENLISNYITTYSERGKGNLIRYCLRFVVDCSDLEAICLNNSQNIEVSTNLLCKSNSKIGSIAQYGDYDRRDFNLNNSSLIIDFLSPKIIVLSALLKRLS